MPELSPQIQSHRKGASKTPFNTNILPHEDDPFVSPHFLNKRFSKGLRYGDLPAYEFRPRNTIR